MMHRSKQETTWEGTLPQPINLESVRVELESLRLRLSLAEENSSKTSEIDLAETRLVREIIRSRRRRDTQFGANLFGEPAWDMLLELYLAHLEQRRTTVSSACRASASPQTTGLRWIRQLQTQGWIQRQSDPLDGRRVWLSLTDRACASMHHYLQLLAVKAA